MGGGGEVGVGQATETILVPLLEVMLHPVRLEVTGYFRREEFNPMLD